MLRVRPVLAVCVLLLVVAAPAAASTVRLTVPPKGAKAWRSAPGQDGTMERLNIYVDGAPISAWERISDCAAWFYGGGVLVRWSGCSTRLRVLAVSSRTTRVRVTVRYKLANGAPF